MTFSCECLVIGVNNVTTEHPSIKEYIEIRKKSFVASHGATSKYNKDAPVIGDSWKGTIYFLVKDDETNRIIGGSRLLVTKAAAAHTLPIASGDKRKDGQPSHITIHPDQCPDKDADYVEISALAIDPAYREQSLATQITRQIFAYTDTKLPNGVFFLSAFPIAEKMAAKMYEQKVRENSSYKYMKIGNIHTPTEKLVVFAATKIAGLDLAALVPHHPDRMVAKSRL